MTTSQTHRAGVTTSGDAQTPSLLIEALDSQRFAPYGDVIEAGKTPSCLINDDRCARFSDLARLDVADPGRVGVSLFDSAACRLPYRLSLMERHPLGSQAFLPMHSHPFLVIVANDEAGRPVAPLAFETNGSQGVNFHRGTWHGVLTPLHQPGLFAVVDRIGEGDNLEEYRFDVPFMVMRRCDV